MAHLTGSRTCEVTTTDIAGQAIEIIRIHETTGQKVLDTRHIPAGVYIYKIESAGYSASGKLIIN